MIKKLISVSVLGLLGATQSAQANIIISEYVEGSSYNKAIELVNLSTSPIDLSQYQIEFYFNGSSSAGRTINLTGTVGANQTFVLGHSSAVAAIKSVANQTEGGSWYNGDDAVVLTLAGQVVDSIGQVGFDPGSAWSSNGVTTANNTIRRSTNVVSGDTNPSDLFTVDAQWQGFGQDVFDDLGNYEGGSTNPPPPPPSGNCNANATLISAVQGSGSSSPLVNQTVTVRAVVSGDFQASNELNGFYLQEENADFDNNSQTSEGLFIYDNGFGIDVSVGDVVEVSGSVEEYYGNTQLKNISSVTVCGTDNISAVDVSLPVNAQDDWEAFEGMAVNFSQSLKVTEVYNLARFGEVALASERLYIPTQVAMPGSAANNVAASNQLKRLLLDDGSSVQNPASVAYPAPALSADNTLRVGDSVNGLTGVIGYAYSQYRIHPISSLQFVTTNAREASPLMTGQGSLRVASFNVLNYFNGNGQGGGFPTSRGASNLNEFNRQQAKIVAAILALDADIIGLMEIENDGYGQYSAIQSLVSAINAAAPAGISYQFVNPGSSQLGSDEIAVGFIYRQQTVSLVGNAATINNAPFDQKNRQPLAQSFKEINSNEVITVAVNHFKSKGSACDNLIYNGVADTDQNDGQGNCNLTRLAAANALADWLATYPTGQQDTDILIIGDLNAYAKEDPIQAIINKGYTNVADSFNGSSAYSYVFSGESGSLDHALASQSLTNKVTDVVEWHINADEPRALDYNLEYKSAQQQQDWYAADAFRASDHDPVIVEIKTSDSSNNGPSLEKQNLSAALREWLYFQIELPAGMSQLNVSIAGGDGDADLYVRQGQQPTTSQYECRPYTAGNDENCQINSPAAGTWHIGIRAYRAFSGVSLSASAN
ncbi:ExeM/NucH family extracellular endonuclease [Aliikangiella maris]|uniref:ExeM/NucH family extracellular endonuclease n=2 Tax=Aliikangiella maris TaxID=3162458 RepID=A0ABV2BYS1_9GAMM